VSPLDLGRALSGAAAGQEVSVEAGEFRGPWTLDRPVRLVGSGATSVLWAPHGPAVTVRARGVHLRDLAIEVTDEPDGVALLVEDGVDAVGLAGVRLHGRAEGLPGGRRWYVPGIVDLGRVSGRGTVARVLRCEVPGPVTARVELDGLEALTERSHDGRVVVRLSVDGAVFPPGTLIEGRLELTGAGITSLVRVTGLVVPAGSSEPSTGSRERAFRALDRAFEQSRASEPRPVHSEPPRRSARDLEREAEAAEGAGDPERAVELLERAGAADRRRAAPRARLAQLLERLGRVEQAAAAWREVVSLEPGAAAAVSLARCCNRLQRFVEAVDVLERALAEPGSEAGADLYRALAMAYRGAGRPDEALWALDRSQSLRFDPRLAALERSWRSPGEGG
jgi:hypothetical protein